MQRALPEPNTRVSYIILLRNIQTLNMYASFCSTPIYIAAKSLVIDEL